MFDWKSASFPGYRPVHEPFMTKIVDVHWHGPTGPTGGPPPFSDRVVIGDVIIAVGTIGMVSNSTGSIINSLRSQRFFAGNRPITAEGFSPIFSPIPDPIPSIYIFVDGGPAGPTSVAATAVDIRDGTALASGTAGYGVLRVAASKAGPTGFPPAQPELLYTATQILGPITHNVGVGGQEAPYGITYSVVYIGKLANPNQP